MRLRSLVLAIGGIALASGLVLAASQRNDLRAERVEAFSPDLMPPRATAPAPFARHAAAPVSIAAAPTEDDVGDIDSFGRKLTWLGVTQANLTLSSDCTATPSDPAANFGCTTLAAGVGAVTTFAFDDIARIVLPKKATHSLLCYWFSPLLVVNWNNPTAADVLGRLRYNPTLTIENEVLAAPGLIDPTTGLPFDGKLLTAMTSSETLVQPLPPGVNYLMRDRESNVCIAGFLTRRALIGTYGLTEAQADAFFKKPTTVRLNISGSSQYVGDSTLIFGLRIIGD
jgi:hypothetical protein